MSDDAPAAEAELDTVESKYSRLHEKIDKTARSRFNASRRLRIHETCSLYTVVLMSCCVIGLTLFDGLEMLAPEAKKIAVFLQVFCSVGVLVYSVILSRSDFALHAYRHHECALELNRLRNTIYKHTVEEPKTDQFTKSSEQYAVILDRFENHLHLDFQMMQVQTPSLYTFYNVTKPYIAWVWCKFLAQFWHYTLFSVLSVVGLLSIYATYGMCASATN